MSFFEEHGSGAISWKKNLVVLWAGVFLACASYTSCIPFLPVYLLKELHVPQDQVNFWSGLVYAVTFLGSAVMAPYWGAWADRVGQRKMAIRAGFGLALTYMLGAIVQTAPQMLGVRILTGLISGFVPASLSLVSSTLPRDKLGWGMGWMQSAIASGSILGPLMGGYLAVWFGMRMSFYVGAGSLFFAAMMVVFLVRDLPFTKDGAGDASVTMSGWIFSLAGIAGIIAAPFWGKRGQQCGFVRILCLVLCCAGCVNLCQVFVSSIWEFAAIQFVYGLFLSGAVPNINNAPGNAGQSLRPYHLGPAVRRCGRTHAGRTSWQLHAHPVCAVLYRRSIIVCGGLYLCQPVA